MVADMSMLFDVDVIFLEMSVLVDVVDGILVAKMSVLVDVVDGILVATTFVLVGGDVVFFPTMSVLVGLDGIITVEMFVIVNVDGILVAEISVLVIVGGKVFAQKPVLVDVDGLTFSLVTVRSNISGVHNFFVILCTRVGLVLVRSRFLLHPPSNIVSCTTAQLARVISLPLGLVVVDEMGASSVPTGTTGLTGGITCVGSSIFPSSTLHGFTLSVIGSPSILVVIHFSISMVSDLLVDTI